jgi:hypothetical protein
MSGLGFQNRHVANQVEGWVPHRLQVALARRPLLELGDFLIGTRQARLAISGSHRSQVGPCGVCCCEVTVSEKLSEKTSEGVGLR